MFDPTVPGLVHYKEQESGIRSGATSTVIGAAVLNAVVVETIALMARMGVKPPVFISANIAGPDEMQSVYALQRAGQRLPTRSDSSENGDGI